MRSLVSSGRIPHSSVFWRSGTFQRRSSSTHFEGWAGGGGGIPDDTISLFLLADLLFLQHVGAWRTIWTEGGRIDIQGNDDLAQTVHSAMYYLLSSSPTDPYDEDITHEWPNFGLSPASLAHSDIIGQVT